MKKAYSISFAINTPSIHVLIILQLFILEFIYFPFNSAAPVASPGPKKYEMGRRSRRSNNLVKKPGFNWSG